MQLPLATKTGLIIIIKVFTNINYKNSACQWLKLYMHTNFLPTRAFTVPVAN